MKPARGHCEAKVNVMITVSLPTLFFFFNLTPISHGHSAAHANPLLAPQQDVFCVSWVWGSFPKWRMGICSEQSANVYC